jgi:hypothetical protein
MIRRLVILAALLPLWAGLFACASREELKAERVATEAADDATCRAADLEPGSEAYELCRQERATSRARQEEIDYQKARDFDRVLGGLDDL